MVGFTASAMTFGINPSSIDTRITNTLITVLMMLHTSIILPIIFHSLYSYRTNRKQFKQVVYSKMSKRRKLLASVGEKKVLESSIVLDKTESRLVDVGHAAYEETVDSLNSSAISTSNLLLSTH
jgi:hypothetical protein